MANCGQQIDVTGLNNLKSPRTAESLQIISVETPRGSNPNNDGLINWKSTAILASDKNLVIGSDNTNCKELNINFSSQYDEGLFSPRHIPPSNRPVVVPVDKSEQEIEIHLSPGKLTHFFSPKF